jgi:Cu2+-exporting ATPase
MMCQNCEKHVRTALESLDGVTAVTKVSHDENLAVIETSEDVSEDTIRAAITDAGYEFVSIK